MKAPRFLIVRFSAIGDIILSAPVIHAIREHYGTESRIDFVTLKRFAGAADLLSGLNVIHLVDNTTSEVVPTLQALEFDYLIDLHGNVRSRSLSKALNILTFNVNKQTIQRFALVLGLRKKPIQHFVERSLNVLQPFGISTPSHPWGSLTSKPIASSIALPKAYITIAPGATHIGKVIPESTLLTICDAFASRNIHVAIVGGPDSIPIATKLISANPNHAITSFCGITTLQETAAIIENTQLIIGGDTGAMHLASALHIPLISIWGCTRPSLGLSPWQPHPATIILLPQDRGSRPCSRHGSKCRFTRRGQDLCIQHVSPSRIIDAATQILNAEQLHK